MANMLNVKGTSFPSFKIGKNGATVYQGSTNPNGTDGLDGDLYIKNNGSDSNFYQKVSGSWTVLVNDNLKTIGALSPDDSSIIIGNGTSWISESGSTARQSLGLEIGADVQAHDVDLDTIAGLSHTNGNVIRSNGTVWESSSLSINDLNDVVIAGASTSQLLSYNGTNWVNQSVTIGTGDVTGPASVVDNVVARFDGTTGKTLQSSPLSIDDNGSVVITQDSGNCKRGLYVVRGTTTDNTPTEIFKDGSSARLVLDNNSLWNFTIKVAARRTDSGVESATYKFEGSIDRGANAASTNIIGSVESSSNKRTAAATWDVIVSADATNGALIITVTGQNAKTILWTATVETVEVKG